MRRLLATILLASFYCFPATAQTQPHPQTRPHPPALVTPAPAPAAVPTPAPSLTEAPAASEISDSTDFSIHPAIAVIAGAVSGVVIAGAVTGTLVFGSLLVEGASLAESLEASTGLSLPLIGASAVLGGMLGHFLSNR